ncbi:MAG TPA: class I SAM-dependent methyltransferase [Gammaproteobacteria bacterium]|nr:class I SAM-dependent methyltransferase [Gammaproteobacteria bacterium]
MRETASLSKRVQREYAALAPEYDRRWRHYLGASLDATLARLPLAATHSVLDVGCGSGELLRRLQIQSPDLALAGVDVSRPMLAIAQLKLGATTNLSQAAADALPFTSDSFDLVVSTSVLHYWPEPARALAEIRRVLTPGGWFVLTDWCGDYLSCRLTAAELRLRRRPLARVYRGAEIQRLLEANGFRIERLERYKISRWWGLMTILTR